MQLCILSTASKASRDRGSRPYPVPFRPRSASCTNGGARVQAPPPCRLDVGRCVGAWHHQARAAPVRRSPPACHCLPGNRRTPSASSDSPCAMLLPRRSNFMSYRDAEISDPGTQLNCIVGPNGTGKSRSVRARSLAYTRR